MFVLKVGLVDTSSHPPYILPPMSITEETATSAGFATGPVAPPRKLAATHPFRVYGYKVSHAWVLQFAKDKGLGRPGVSNDRLKSAVFLHLLARLPGLQRHFLDDPDEPSYGWSHCLAIANNWNPKKKLLVAGRLPKWKAVLETEGEPRWYIPTRDTTPPVPPEYQRFIDAVLKSELAATESS